jgi:hypothetical protein
MPLGQRGRMAVVGIMCTSHHCHVAFFSFPVAVKNSIKVGSLVFMLYMFVITENIMKQPVEFCPGSYARSEQVLELYMCLLAVQPS